MTLDDLIYLLSVLVFVDCFRVLWMSLRLLRESAERHRRMDESNREFWAKLWSIKPVSIQKMDPRLFDVNLEREWLRGVGEDDAVESKGEPQ